MQIILVFVSYVEEESSYGCRGAYGAFWQQAGGACAYPI